MRLLFLLIITVYLVLPAPAAVASGKPLGFAPKKTAHHLVIYFHALGGATHEPYVQPIKGAAIVDAVKTSYPGAGFLSLDYNPSLVLQGDFEDIDNTILDYKHDFPNVDSISLCGSSFGGYTALAYYTKASPEVQSLINGIVVSGVPDDLQLLSKSSVDKDVKNLLQDELSKSGSPTFLKDRSVSQIFKSVKKPTNVFIITMKKDVTVPAACNKDLEANLKARGCNVAIEKIDEGHCFPSIYFLEQGFLFVSKKRKHFIN